ncbi:hypothetical protein HRI_002983000 [Hibiscus trionum]|uniref:Uncharacterized protein n=1 Tax=Hibiscus trionum TaxID=183268 RepID=A0A9W7M7L9_HIBTR|nr:hypothetical protein HRI_002983000 [Hibiscus trionum]
MGVFFVHFVNYVLKWSYSLVRNFRNISKVSLEKIDDGVPTGLSRRLELPDLPGDVEGLKLNGGLTISSFGLIMFCLLSWSFEIGLFKPGPFVVAACAGSPSDRPVNRCTISWKVLESVCTNVVKGLRLVAVRHAGFSIVTSLFEQALMSNSLVRDLHQFYTQTVMKTYVGYVFRWP